MNPSKIQKDVRDLADIVLMTEIKRNEDAINHFQQNLQVLYGERDRRIQQHVQVTGTEMRQEPKKTAQPDPAGTNADAKPE